MRNKVGTTGYVLKKYTSTNPVLLLLPHTVAHSPPKSYTKTLAHEKTTVPRTQILYSNNAQRAVRRPGQNDPTGHHAPGRHNDRDGHNDPRGHPTDGTGLDVRRVPHTMPVHGTADGHRHRWGKGPGDDNQWTGTPVPVPITQPRYVPAVASTGPVVRATATPTVYTGAPRYSNNMGQPTVTAENSRVFTPTVAQLAAHTIPVRTPTEKFKECGSPHQLAQGKRRRLMNPEPWMRFHPFVATLEHWRQLRVGHIQVRSHPRRDS